MKTSKNTTGIPDDTCSICCHETRNAICAVVYFAKEAKSKFPDMETALLDAAIIRLEGLLRKCASGEVS